MYTYNILYGRCHNYRMEVEEYESTVVYRTLFCSFIPFSSEGWENYFQPTPNFFVVL